MRIRLLSEDPFAVCHAMTKETYTTVFTLGIRTDIHVYGVHPVPAAPDQGLQCSPLCICFLDTSLRGQSLVRMFLGTAGRYVE